MLRADVAQTRGRGGAGQTSHVARPMKGRKVLSRVWTLESKFGTLCLRIRVLYPTLFRCLSRRALSSLRVALLPVSFILSVALVLCLRLVSSTRAVPRSSSSSHYCLFFVGPQVGHPPTQGQGCVQTAMATLPVAPMVRTVEAVLR